MQLDFDRAIREGRAAPKPTYKGETISLDLTNVALGAVFGLLSDFTGTKFEVDPAIIYRPITVNFTDTPWDQAVDEMANRYNLKIRRDQRRGAAIYVMAR